MFLVWRWGCRRRARIFIYMYIFMHSNGSRARERQRGRQWEQKSRKGERKENTSLNVPAQRWALSYEGVTISLFTLSLSHFATYGEDIQVDSRSIRITKGITSLEELLDWSENPMECGHRRVLQLCLALSMSHVRVSTVKSISTTVKGAEHNFRELWNEFFVSCFTTSLHLARHRFPVIFLAV